MGAAVLWQEVAYVAMQVAAVRREDEQMGKGEHRKSFWGVRGGGGDLPLRG